MLALLRDRVPNGASDARPTTGSGPERGERCSPYYGIGSRTGRAMLALLRDRVPNGASDARPTTGSGPERGERCSPYYGSSLAAEHLAGRVPTRSDHDAASGVRGRAA